jgi:asparagine synthase (glutamine-hydrolysing)
MRNLGIHFHGYSASWPTSDKARYNFDSKLALEIAKTLGISFEIVEMPTAEEIPVYFEKVINAIGEPFNNPTAISQFALFERIAKDGHKLVITGDGADEIFAGYPRYKIDNSQNKFLCKLAEIETIDKFFEMWSLNRSTGIRYSRTLLRATNPIRASSWHWVFSPSEIREFHPEFNSIKFPQLNIPKDERIANLGLINPSRRMIFDMSYDRHVWLTDHSNKMLDRMSMAHSIEARSPFQSEELINMCLNLSPTTLISAKTKPKMREAFPELEKLVKVRDDKAGFQSPIGYWLRENREYFSQVILDGSKEMQFSQKQIERLVKDGFTGTHIERVKLWTLASLFVWNKTCR